MVDSRFQLFFLFANLLSRVQKGLPIHDNNFINATVVSDLGGIQFLLGSLFDTFSALIPKRCPNFSNRTAVTLPYPLTSPLSLHPQ